MSNQYLCTEHNNVSMKICHIHLITLALAAVSLSAPARQAHIASPDGSIVVSVSDELPAGPSFSVTVDGKPVIEPSRFALDIRGLKPASRITKTDTRTGLQEHITSPFYRQPEFDFHYNRMRVKLDNGIVVEWRATDEGVAYRFETSRRDSSIVGGEILNLDFAGDPTVYLSFSTNDKKPMAMAFQNFYDVTPLSHAKDKLAFLPATVDMGDGLKITILESDMKSYPGMYLQADSMAGKLEARFAPFPKKFDYYPGRRQQRYVTDTEDYIARTVGTRTFPWRVMAITRRDTDMPVNNLVYALAEPAHFTDTGWIRPGKVAWDWWNDWGLTGVPFKAGINTETYKYYIDFAADNGLEYVVLDEGWYDPKSGDMLTVIDDIDLTELISYGRSRGVDIVLWTVFNVLDDQLEEACSRYAAMGVKGFKVDFLDRDDQEAVEMTYRIADACARHRLFLDYHGIYKPTGLNRTYPNVLNYEGVFGLEEVKWTKPTTDFPRYDVTFPYIRMMAGQVDYTPGAMTNATKADWKARYYHPMSMGTRAHQLSCYIIHDSPFTMLCDAPTNYRGEEACVDFVALLPVIFDETRVIDGRLGEYIVTMRSAGGCYYVGGATDWNERDLTLDLSFLPDGMNYRMVILYDGPNAHRHAEDYAVRIDTVSRSSRLTVHMAPGGGFAARLEPVSVDAAL